MYDFLIKDNKKYVLTLKSEIIAPNGETYNAIFGKCKRVADNKIIKMGKEEEHIMIPLQEVLYVSRTDHIGFSNDSIYEL